MAGAFGSTRVKGERPRSQMPRRCRRRPLVSQSVAVPFGPQPDATIEQLHRVGSAWLTCYELIGKDRSWSVSNESRPIRK